MKSLGLVCVATLVCLSAAGAARAQMMHGGPPGMTGLWHPVVGGGGVYEVASQEGPKRTMEFVIVGKEKAEAADAVWLELTMTVPNMNNGEAIVKELVSFDPANMRIQVFKAVMQMPGGVPMEMPDQMVRSREPIQYKDARGNSEDLGSERVSTPAGTFSCRHYRAKDGSGDAWVSERVAPFGLVKFQSKDQTITLVKTISDAKDKITGTPQPFDPMLMMKHAEQ